MLRLHLTELTHGDMIAAEMEDLCLTTFCALLTGKPSPIQSDGFFRVNFTVFRYDFLTYGWDKMARRSRGKDANKNTPESGYSQELRWANVPLDHEDVERIKQSSLDFDGVVHYLVTSVLSAWDISLRFRPETKTATAFGFRRFPELQNTLVGVSATAGTRTIALAALLYKLQVLEENPANFVSEGDEVGIR